VREDERAKVRVAACVQSSMGPCHVLSAVRKIMEARATSLDDASLDDASHALTDLAGPRPSTPGNSP
jgi:hypothetical protein